MKESCINLVLLCCFLYDIVVVMIMFSV